MSAAEVTRQDSLTAARHLLEQADFTRAAELLRQALADHGDDPELVLQLAELYESAEQHGAAREAYYRLARLLPEDPAPYLRSARVCARVSDNGGVEKDLRKALARDPSHELASTMLATFLGGRGRIEDERDLLLKVAGTANSDAAAIARFKAAFTQPVVARSETEVDETRGRFAAALEAGPERPIEDPFRAGLLPVFLLNYQARNDRSFHEAYARYCLAATPSLGMSAPHIGSSARGRRIRIGLFSAYFSNQTVGYLNYGLVEGLDRRLFDLVLFRPSHARHDEETDRFRAIARLVDIPGDLDAARAAIASEKLDILHYPEIGMDAFTYFLAYSRLATIQTMAWGHPVTSGLASIDHFLSVDDMEPVDGQMHYRENLVRLKSPTFSCERPSAVSDDRNALGIESGPAYVCPQSLCKIHPRFDEALARILANDPSGRLYFVSNGEHIDELLRGRLAQSMAGNVLRVKFLPRLHHGAFLGLIRAADVVLDVPQWSGGRTSLETLAMGTPIVHQPGEFMRGRHTLAFYRRMGLTSPVVESTDAYVEAAYRLVHDEKFRAETRAHIAETSPRLFSDQGAIREVEGVWSALLAART